MVTTSTDDTTMTVNLQELADFTKVGVHRQTLVKDEHTNFALICVSAGTQLPEHTANRNVSITVILGQGILTLAGRNVDLTPGVFVYMPANTPHALHATENLAFLHT